MCFISFSRTARPRTPYARQASEGKRNRSIGRLRISIDTKCNRRAQRFPLCSRVPRARAFDRGRKIVVRDD